MVFSKPQTNTNVLSKGKNFSKIEGPVKIFCYINWLHFQFSFQISSAEQVWRCPGAWGSILVQLVSGQTLVFCWGMIWVARLWSKLTGDKLLLLLVGGGSDHVDTWWQLRHFTRSHKSLLQGILNSAHTPLGRLTLMKSYSDEAKLCATDSWALPHLNPHTNPEVGNVCQLCLQGRKLGSAGWNDLLLVTWLRLNRASRLSIFSCFKAHVLPLRLQICSNSYSSFAC